MSGRAVISANAAAIRTRTGRWLVVVAAILLDDRMRRAPRNVLTAVADTAPTPVARGPAREHHSRKKKVVTTYSLSETVIRDSVCNISRK